MTSSSHLDDTELAAFVDGGLDDEARAAVESHLTGCDECRALLASTALSLTTPARRSYRRALIPVGLAAAAILAFVLIRPGGTPKPDSTRDADISGAVAPAFAANAPAEDAAIRLDTLTFRWTSAGSDVTYQLTLSTEGGEILWSERTANTVLALPDSIRSRLESGLAYYWQVDALLPNLRSASTGQRRLVAIVP